MNHMKPASTLIGIGAIVGIVIAAVVVILIIALVSWWVKKMNFFRQMQVKIKEALSGIDVALTKRYDLLTKQYNIVKGYAKHENETLVDVTKMRANYQEGSGEVKAMNAVNNQMNQLSKSINIVIERYPELKANTMFISLSNSCTEVEEHLQASRRLFNANVSTYNQAIVTFPGSIVASAIHATPEEFFKADEEKRQDVKMEF